MTPEEAKEREIAEAKERIKAVGRDWIAEGRAAGAFAQAIKEIEGYGLNWNRENGK